MESPSSSLVLRRGDFISKYYNIRSVERNLEPLVMQVTTLVSSKSPQKKKGKSKRAHVLVAAVEKATANFVEKGEIIAMENPG